MDYSWRFDVDSALCVGLPRWILPMLLGKEFFEEKNWTVGKNIFYYILLLLLMATGNYLYICAFFTSAGFSFSMFLTITMNTFLIGIFPVGLMTILTENRNMSRHLKEVASMNACIHREKPSMLSEPSALLAKIVLPDGIKETLELEPEEFRLAEADLSEAEALKAFRYLSLMNQNPSVNGPKYGGNIMVALEKAKKRNPDNPRAIILSAVYHKNMAAFMNQKYEEYDKEVAHAKELLLKQDSMKCAPVWGMNVCH